MTRTPPKIGSAAARGPAAAQTRSSVGLFLAATSLLAVLPTRASTAAAGEGLRDEPYQQQEAVRFSVEHGLPSNDVTALVRTQENQLVAGTDLGLARLEPGHEARFSALEVLAGQRIDALAVGPDGVVYALSEGGIHMILVEQDDVRRLVEAPGVTGMAVRGAFPSPIVMTSKGGLLRDRHGATVRLPLAIEGATHDIGFFRIEPSGAGGRIRHLAAVGAARGLLLRDSSANDPRAFEALTPRQGTRSWAPTDVGAVAFDSRDRLWFGSAQGVGVYDFSDQSWRLFDASDGLPWTGFTSAAPGLSGDVWFGTDRGLVHVSAPENGDSTEHSAPEFEYRQGRRWLPHDHVRSVVLDDRGTVYAATEEGIGVIRLVSTTLAEKAQGFEQAIERHHLRTPYGYVDAVELAQPGAIDTATQRSSDNDGLWTAMYGAAHCFAYAATGDQEAKRRAERAFRALRFLGEVTQGGSLPARPGFVARSILPTDGPDPNEGRSKVDQQLRQERDRSWKLIDPRWPKSADGRWYWKSDTSSDELDGHYFFYALYHDLVADSAEEKRAVRDVVVAITDHLLDHDFALVDHDGKPTRWAVFGPQQLNHDKNWWEERGLNSLSVLAYLRVAEHVSQEPRFEKAAQELIEQHAYAANVRVPKIQSGPGTGNQSDDEMAFMGYYHLLRYEKDEALAELWAHSLSRYWELVEPENNPFFNLVFAASIEGRSYRDAFADDSLEADEARWLSPSLEALRRYPFDRLDWGLSNSHRLDIVPLGRLEEPNEPPTRGHLRSGRVLPIDERFVNHWNHDPWQLDYPGQGQRLADGASFLLPYYMALHHGFLEPTAAAASEGEAPNP